MCHSESMLKKIKTPMSVSQSHSLPGHSRNILLAELALYLFVVMLACDYTVKKTVNGTEVYCTCTNTDSVDGMFRISTAKLMDI